MPGRTIRRAPILFVSFDSVRRAVRVRDGDVAAAAAGPDDRARVGGMVGANNTPRDHVQDGDDTTVLPAEAVRPSDRGARSA